MEDAFNWAETVGRNKMKKAKMKVVITSMYANPIHPGHIECLEKARALGDYLIVIVNNDEQQKLKNRGTVFQDQVFRKRVVGALKSVDETFLSIDTDGAVCESIRAVVERCSPHSELIFAKGGDRNVGNIPEVEICKELGVEIVDGLGKKIDNSSKYRLAAILR